MDIESIKKFVQEKHYRAAAIFAAIAVVVGIMVFMVQLSVRGNNKDYAQSGSQLIIVKDGMTTVDIAELLHEKKLVKDVAAFRMEARVKGLATKLQAGAYQLEGGMSRLLT